MENLGVKCDVCECMHNIDHKKCDLNEIEVTHQETSQCSSIDTPHFCKSYQKK